MPGGNLCELIELVGSLPERAICYICKRVLQILNVSKSIDNFEVMFDREGKLKLGLSFDESWANSIYKIGYLALWAAMGETQVLDAEVTRCCLFHSLDKNLFTERFSP